MHRGVVLIAVVIAAACGDNGGEPTDAATAADAAPAPDAFRCPLVDDAPEVAIVDMFSPQLDVQLDGVGTRCEQAIAALPQLIGAFPGVDRLLAGSQLVQCDDFLHEVVLEFGPPAEIGGLRLVAPPWSAQAIVFFPEGETFFSGTFFDIVELPPPACLSDIDIILGLPGHELAYTELSNCAPSGAGTYTITVGDAYLLRDQVFLVEQGPFATTIKRAREVDLHLLPSHVTEPILFSDFNCCEGPSLVDCVGARLLVSVFSDGIHQQGRLCDCSP